MTYFSQTAGPNTRPLITNDLEKYGVQLDPYSMRIANSGKFLNATNEMCERTDCCNTCNHS